LLDFSKCLVEVAPRRHVQAIRDDRRNRLKLLAVRESGPRHGSGRF